MALWDKVCFFKSFMFSVYVDGVEWLVGPWGQSPTLVETPECFSVSSSLCLHMWGKDTWGQGQNTGIWGLLILRGWLANELQEYQSVSTARAGVPEVLAACTSENLIELTLDRALGAWYPDKSRHSTKCRMIINISLWLWYFPEPIEQKILVKELPKL